MVLILIIAFLATGKFYRTAKIAGLHPGRAASVPFVNAGVVFLVGWLGNAACTALFAAMPVKQSTQTLIGFAFDLFLILVYLVVIGQNWRALENAAATAKDIAE